MSCCFRTKLIFSDQAAFNTSLSFSEDTGFALKFSEAGGRHPTYDGDYEVIPRFVTQDLPTQGLLMRDDIFVHSIKVHSVSNVQGVRTVTIGTP